MKITAIPVTIVATHSALPLDYTAVGLLYPNGHVIPTTSFKDESGAEFKPDPENGITLFASEIILPDGRSRIVDEAKAGIFVRMHPFNKGFVFFEEGGIHIENPFISSCGRFECKPTDYGFEVWDLGGGTKGYGKQLPDGNRIILTNQEGDDLPTGEEDALIGLYNSDAEEILCHDVPTAEVLMNRINGHTHRELYPEQYSHALCGKKVEVISGPSGERITGTVLRVVNSRFGQLAILEEHGDDKAWAIGNLRQIS